MSHRNGIMKRSVLSAELSGEPIGGTPLVEILGDKRVLIENHKGIRCYSCNIVSVNTNCGCICIDGERLEIVNMTKQRLVITGKVQSVTLQSGR